MKEVIKVIKENLSFKELPKDIKEAKINDCADWIIIVFDEGVCTKRTAWIDAKNNYENNDEKYVLYRSYIHGICSYTHNEFYNTED